jgi:hypothetical protein
VSEGDGVAAEDFLSFFRSELVKRLHYWRWRLRHPFGNFQSYYVDLVEQRLDAGEAHETLGAKYKDPVDFAASGEAIVDFLRGQGLDPRHRLVDYGCGSLRVGRHIMSYLDPGNYVGMDITDRFFSDGLTEIGKEAVEHARPTMRVISDSSIEEIAGMSPDWIFSTGVVIHVPPGDMQGFVDRLWSLSRAGTRFVIRFRAAETGERRTGVSWFHSTEFVAGFFEAKGANVELIHAPDLADNRSEDSQTYPTYYLATTREI